MPALDRKQSADPLAYALELWPRYYTSPAGMAEIVFVIGRRSRHRHTTPPSDARGASRSKAENGPAHSRRGLADFRTSTG